MNAREKLLAWIDSVVAVEGLQEPVSVDAKLDALGYLVDQLKRQRKAMTPAIPFEDFAQAHADVIEHVLFIVLPKELKRMGKGISPVELQVPLLLFLLIHHRDRHTILGIIDLFTKRLSDQFTEVDYKRTSTGVIRCYTNTRFAALRLRDYGLLRYTYKEAYKTWELSLIGLMVASVLFHKRAAKDLPWQIPAKDRNTVVNISEEILQALDEVKDYRSFVERLKWICAPRTNLFETFGPALEGAYKLLPAYIRDLSSADLKEADRQKIGQQFIKQLEQEGIDDKFHEEFSISIQLNELLRGKY